MIRRKNDVRLPSPVFINSKACVRIRRLLVINPTVFSMLAHWARESSLDLREAGLVESRRSDVLDSLLAGLKEVLHLKKRWQPRHTRVIWKALRMPGQKFKSIYVSSDLNYVGI